MAIVLSHNEGEVARSEHHFGWNVGYSDQKSRKYTISITSEYIQDCLGERGNQDEMLSAILDNEGTVSASVDKKGAVFNETINRFECRLNSEDCPKG